MKKLNLAGQTLFIVVSFIVGGRAVASLSDGKCGADFQVVTDGATYAAGARMRVKLLVTNTGEGRLYFFRGLTKCSSQLGSFLLLILDKNGNEANRSGCSSEVLMEKVDVVAELTTPESGIMLKTGEIYGIEANIELPAKTGVYRLKAELVPAAFTSEQKEALSRKDIRVLQERCAAPVVSITVK